MPLSDNTIGMKIQEVYFVATKQRKIIIVDDDKLILGLLSHEFKALGFDIQTFEIGKEALDFLLKESNLTDVFLLVLDRVLPDMDGLDIWREFKAKSSIKIPTLILSVLSSEKDVMLGLQAGVIDYIGKPFSVYRLVEKALSLLKEK